MTCERRRILVIEDNPTNLELLMFLLQASGHTAIAARDGLAGLQQAKDLKPDLIICDIQLPTIDGYEVARQIKSDPALRGLMLIAVTACAMSADRQRALAAGFDGYISKPITPYTFCEQISRYFPVRDQPADEPEPTPAPLPALATPHADGPILIAQHSTVNLNFLTSVLDLAARAYTTAWSVDEALELMQAQSPSRMLIEADLPGGGAEELLVRSEQSCLRGQCPALILMPTDHAADPFLLVRRFTDCEVIRWPIDPAALLRWLAGSPSAEPCASGAVNT